jgi:hypothetical protein
MMICLRMGIYPLVSMAVGTEGHCGTWEQRLRASSGGRASRELMFSRLRGKLPESVAIMSRSSLQVDERIDDRRQAVIVRQDMPDVGDSSI